MQNYIRVLVATLILSALSNNAFAAWGDYDTTFGTLGMAVDSIANHYPESIAVQPDGKILVTGWRRVGTVRRLFLRRYLSNGQVDTSFGNNGSAISNGLLATYADYMGFKIVVQANGRIAVLGVGNGTPTLWRFTSSGSSDTSIGYGGMKALTGYGMPHIKNLATYANILYVGLTKNSPAVPTVIKFHSNGTRDMDFGNAGELSPTSSTYYTVRTEAGTGNILIGGKKSNSSAYGIERFLPSGQLDPTFNHYDTTYDQGQPLVDGASSFIQLLDGRFVLNEVWASYSPYPPYHLGSYLVRFAPDGAYQGRTAYIPGGPQQYFAGPCPNILDQQSNGRVIARGVNSDKLYRFSTSFFTINTMTCDSYAPLESRTDATLQADGKMLGAGTYNGDMAIVRTLP